MTQKKKAVVALGGNAITRPDVEDTIANQFANTRQSLEGVVELTRLGYDIVVTHGNGPQVGNALLRIELALDKAPALPLGVIVADTEGGMGYMISQSLQNRLRQEKITNPVVTIITQILVDEKDPAFGNPTKYVGQFYTEEQAQGYITSRGWQMKADGDRGWRRVVPSPRPIEVIEKETIRMLVNGGAIVIAGGGGGIPVYLDAEGNYEGIDAVVDKDQASAVIGKEIGAELLCIMTSVDRVALNFGKPDQVDLESLTLTQARKYLADGQFPAGSMGPKIEAAIRFLEGGGKTVIVCSLEQASQALRGKAGTRIVRD